MSNEQAPECCPFCGAGPTTEGEEKWSSEIGKYRCGTISHAFEPDDRWQTSQCRIAERERLTRGLETCRQRSYEKALRIQDLKSRLQLAQDDLTVRIKEVEKVEQERDALAQKATAMAVQVSEQIKRWDATIRENERLTRELDELRAWKESAMAVEREWDANAIATMIGGIPGESQRKVIAREVPKLLDRVKRLEEAGEFLDDVADAADDDIREYLQVANYNLHGLLNTGERIQPPNPPQTIHQAGIDASVAVREDIRKARNEWRKAKEAKP